MKLSKRLKKTMLGVLVSTMILSTTPIIASDYDNHWAKESIVKWNEYGVVKGHGEGVFKPNDEVTRAELAAFITRAFGLESTHDATNFADVLDTAWYAEDIAKVSSAGIMNGSSGKFNPAGYATRQEVAVTLVNAFKLTGEEVITFSDEDEISTWAKQSVAILASNGYANGKEGNKFDPKANITRAEVVKLLDNIVEELVYAEGTYTKNIEGNLVVNTDKVLLDNTTVNNDLYLTQGIGFGDTTIQNTKILGNIFVLGNVLALGDEIETVYLDSVNVEGKIIVDSSGPVRLVSKNSSLNVEAKTKQDIVLMGTYSEVVVPAGSSIDLKGAIIDRLVISSNGDEKAIITMDEDSIIKELVIQGPTSIKGTGEIELLVVESDGVTSEITPEELEVKEGIENPELPKAPIGGGGSGGTGGGGGSTGGGTVSPETSYIQVESISVISETGEIVSIPTSIVNVVDKDILVDLSDVNAIKNILPTTIVGGNIKFSNLKEGDKINAVIDFTNEKLDDIEINYTVESGNVVTCDVLKLATQFKDMKPSIIKSLNEIGVYTELERILNKFDLSMEKDYLLDGNIDVNKSIDKMVQILTYIKDNKENPKVAGKIQQIEMELKSHGIAIDLENEVVTGKIAIEAGTLGKSEYSITIKY